MRTEQQQRIESALLDLVKRSGSRLKVIFTSSFFESTPRTLPKSSARRLDYLVELNLVETDNLNNWGDAIVDAETILSDIENELIHEYNNPNFFKAIRYKISYLK